MSLGRFFLTFWCAPASLHPPPVFPPGLVPTMCSTVCASRVSREVLHLLGSEQSGLRGHTMRRRGLPCILGGISRTVSCSTCCFLARPVVSPGCAPYRPHLPSRVPRQASLVVCLRQNIVVHSCKPSIGLSRPLCLPPRSTRLVFTAQSFHGVTSLHLWSTCFRETCDGRFSVCLAQVIKLVTPYLPRAAPFRRVIVTHRVLFITPSGVEPMSTL